MEEERPEAEEEESETEEQSPEPAETEAEETDVTPEARIAELEAQTAPKVKALVWDGPFPANGYKRGRWTAAGRFSVVRKGEDYWRIYRDRIDEHDKIYPTEDAAKAAAQAHYEALILGALEKGDATDD